LRVFIVLILILSYVGIVNGQNSDKKNPQVYRLNYAFEIPASVGLYIVNYYGLQILKKKDPLDSLRVMNLNKNNVWCFDRIALEQTSSQRQSAQNISDWGQNIAIFTPILLAIDKDIRQDWFEVALLYLEAQAINTNLYTWGGPMFTTRIRPVAYYDDVPMLERTARGNTDSFFSGHTSATATASFFMAKVISDYHPELGAKKWYLFAAALGPPVFVGFFRYNGLRHFPTDIIMGTAIGAAVGVLVPHLHKITNKNNKNLSIVPYTGNYSGLLISLRF